MGMFGMVKKPSFGQQFDPMSNGPFGTPPIADPNRYGQPAMGMDEPAQKKTGANWVGVLADFLSGATGGQPMFAQQQYRNREDDRQAQQRAMQMQEQRQYQRDDHVWRSEYDRANPKPKDPYRFESNDGSQIEIGPDGQPRVLYKDPTPKTTYITADNGDGTKMIVPIVNGVPQMGVAQGAPPRPVGKLRPLGGGGSNVTSGF